MELNNDCSASILFGKRSMGCAVLWATELKFTNYLSVFTYSVDMKQFWTGLLSTVRESDI